MIFACKIFILIVIFAATVSFRLRTAVHSHFSLVRISKASANLRTTGLALAGGNLPTLDDATRDRLEKIISTNKVVLFMKGNKLFPQCGFSNTACRLLDAIGTPYETVNVLDDDNIRQGIKVFSSWPTIPQLYVAGEFVGGSDIMIEMYQSGALAEMIEVANAN